jgi:hypothetical protein
MRELRAKHASPAPEKHSMKLIMTFENFVRSSTIFNGGARKLAVLLLCLPAFGAIASDPEEAILVGEVSLVIGKAYIQSTDKSTDKSANKSADNNRRPVLVGTAIRVNDEVTTTGNGHVHIHFVDDALVSVRPESRLEILRYDYNSRQPEQSTVKFNLIEGVFRSISGDAARNARQRFRLNTPIAAIGVRGTDFVVSANRKTVRALVNEGTIVMAPFSADCTADSLGPCAVNAVELTGDSLQILELNAETPTLLPASHERDPSMMREEVQLALSDNGAANDESDGDENTNDAYLENVASRKLTEEAAEVAASQLIVNEPDPIESDPIDPTPIEPEPIPDFTPSVQVAAEVLTERQLVWGHWAWLGEGQGDLERISIAAEVASADREIAIRSGEYGLFRDEQGRTPRVDTGLGVVGFNLSSAQAFYDSGSGVVAMQVKSGSLGIDFDTNQFTTELNLNHFTTGAIDFIAAGRIYSGGYFYDRSDTQNIRGAVSLDGKEAGYYFDRQLETGAIQGLTLWDSQ